jgi:hypothetical protein
MEECFPTEDCIFLYDHPEETIWYAPGYVRFPVEDRVEQMFLQLLLWDFPMELLAKASLMLPPVPRTNAGLPPTPASELLMTGYFRSLLSRAKFLGALVTLCLRWSIIPGPQRQAFVEAWVQALPLARSDAFSLGSLIAVAGTPRTPGMDRVLTAVYQNLAAYDFEELHIDEDLSPESCFWLGCGLAHERRRCVFLSHFGEESKMLLVDAVKRAEQIRPQYVFLDCLTRPEPGANNQLFLWQNLWASRAFVRVDSPSFELSKWCREEVIAANVVRHVLPELFLFSEIWPFGSDLRVRLTEIVDRVLSDDDAHLEIVNGFKLCRYTDTAVLEDKNIGPKWLELQKKHGQGFVSIKEIVASNDLAQALLRTLGSRQLGFEIVEPVRILDYILTLHHVSQDALKAIIDLIVNKKITQLFIDFMQGKGCQVWQSDPPACFGLFVRDPLQDPSWIVSLFPTLKEPVFVLQLRGSGVVESHVGEFSLQYIPCLTANSEAELRQLLNASPQVEDPLMEEQFILDGEHVILTRYRVNGSNLFSSNEDEEESSAGLTSSRESDH